MLNTISPKPMKIKLTICAPDGVSPVISPYVKAMEGLIYWKNPTVIKGMSLTARAYKTSGIAVRAPPPISSIIYGMFKADILSVIKNKEKTKAKGVIIKLSTAILAAGSACAFFFSTPYTAKDDARQMAIIGKLPNAINEIKTPVKAKPTATS
jgi:hypothetical protein